MRKKQFQDLVGSIKEAGRIHRSEIAPSRESAFDSGDVEAVRDRLEGMLLDGLDSGKPTVATPEYWEGKKVRIVRARRRTKRS